MHETDEELVRRVLDGDVRAYGFLMERNKDRCIRYVFRALGDMDAAEDVVQEAFVRGYRSLAQCNDPIRFRPWLFQIVVNCCRSASTKLSKRKHRFIPLADRETEIDARTKGTETEHPQAARIELALAALPEQMREAILLKYMEDMTYEEMSEATGASISALKMRVTRAIQILRKSLTKVPAGGASC